LLDFDVPADAPNETFADAGAENFGGSDVVAAVDQSVGMTDAGKGFANPTSSIQNKDEYLGSGLGGPITPSSTRPKTAEEEAEEIFFSPYAMNAMHEAKFTPDFLSLILGG